MFEGFFRGVAYIVGLILVLYGVFFVPLGRRTLFQHARRIAATPAAQELRGEMKRAATRVTGDLKREIDEHYIEGHDRGVYDEDEDVYVYEDEEVQEKARPRTKVVPLAGDNTPAARKAKTKQKNKEEPSAKKGEQKAKPIAKSSKSSAKKKATPSKKKAVASKSATKKKTSNAKSKGTRSSGKQSRVVMSAKKRAEQRDIERTRNPQPLPINRR